MQENEFRYYEFGEFVLDVRRRSLRKNEREIRLTTRNFELLHFLVCNEGRVLEHDELLNGVWAGTFVEQSNLKKGISALRQILEETPGESLYIKTVPRKGYSFVAPVRPLTDQASDYTIRRVTITEIEEEEIVYDDSDEKTVRALPAPESKQTASKRWLWAGVSAALLLTSAFIGWKYFFHSGAPPEFRQLQINQLTNLGNAVIGGVSPDGEQLFFCQQEGASISCRAKNLLSGETRPLLAPQKARIYAATFAPDDKNVYLWLSFDESPEKNGIYRASTEGGEPSKVSDKNTGIAFAPDGRRIAYTQSNINEQGESGLFTANADFTDEKLLFGFRAPQSSIILIDWSPDGKFVTYTISRLNENQREYYIAQRPAGGGGEQIIAKPRPQTIFALSWFPDGKGLAVTAVDPKTQFQQIYYVSADGGEWQKITNDFTWYWNAEVTAGGRSIVSTQQRDVFSLWVGDAGGQNFRQITFDTIPYDPDCIWLDEETILYSAKSGDNTDLWAMNADGQNRRQLTSGQKKNYLPRASADGRQIFFLSNRSGTKQVWRMDKDGSNQLQVTNAVSDIDDFRPLPDGRTVVYSVYLAGRGWSLFKKAIDAPEFKALPFSNMSDWTLSPDGQTIAFDVQTEQGHKVRVSRLEDNKTVTELEIGEFDSIVWTRDGKALLFDAFNNERNEIFVQPLSGGAARPLTAFNSEENIWNFDLSPAGKKIVMRRVRQYFDLIRLDFETNR